MEASKKTKETALPVAKKSWWESARVSVDSQLANLLKDYRFVENYSELEKGYGFINYTANGPDGKKFVHVIAYKPNGFGPGLIHFYFVDPNLTMEFSEQDYQLNINP